jgi:hypothetical protein
VAYVFAIDDDPTTLCGILRVSRIGELGLAPGGRRMAHVHRGDTGTSGPVAVNLAWPQDGRSTRGLLRQRPQGRVLLGGSSGLSCTQTPTDPGRREGGSCPVRGTAVRSASGDVR